MLKTENEVERIQYSKIVRQGTVKNIVRENISKNYKNYGQHLWRPYYRPGIKLSTLYID